MTDPPSRQRGRPKRNKNHNSQYIELKIWSWVPEGARHQDWLADWPSAVTWLWLWLWGIACPSCMALLHVIWPLYWQSATIHKAWTRAFALVSSGFQKLNKLQTYVEIITHKWKYLHQLARSQACLHCDVTKCLQQRTSTVWFSQGRRVDVEM
jgi:hypothetical protein